MEFTTRPGRDGTEFILSGRLTFKDLATFPDVFEGRNDSGVPRKVLMDISDVEFIDSAGLGMLISLREKAAAANAEITLRKPAEKVRRIFKACDFYSLFTIED
jgi:HptB-dependent secretion and biofilm anti anti-sigma factor